jgi:ribose transport system ATP-binding protein
MSFGGVRDAEEAGVAIIHQELNLVPDLSVADNIFLGREPLIAGVLIDRRRIVRAAERLLRHLGVNIDPERRVAELRIGEQQLVEIAKALSLDARILIMDEPTSALSSSECETLFKIVRQLAGDGVAIIYTSHRIEEVIDLADRVTVLRDGRRVLTAPIAEVSRGTLISAMVGREMATSHRGTVAQGGAIVLSVRNLTLDTLDRRGCCTASASSFGEVKSWESAACSARVAPRSWNPSLVSHAAGVAAILRSMARPSTSSRRPMPIALASRS